MLGSSVSLWVAVKRLAGGAFGVQANVLERAPFVFDRDNQSINQSSFYFRQQSPHTHTHTPTTNYTFPLPFSVAVITYINFVLPCFLPSYFSLPIFPVALFSGCRFCRCRFFFSCPVYQLPFYRCRFTFYPVCVCWRTHRRAQQKRMNRSRCCLDSTQPCVKWGVHISTAWRIRLNDTCSATMRRGWEYR